MQIDIFGNQIIFKIDKNDKHHCIYSILITNKIGVD